MSPLTNLAPNKRHTENAYCVLFMTRRISDVKTKAFEKINCIDVRGEQYVLRETPRIILKRLAFVKSLVA